MIMIVVILMQENCNVHDALHDTIGSNVHQSGIMWTHILFYIVLNTTYTFIFFFFFGGGGWGWGGGGIDAYMHTMQKPKG